MNNNFKCPICGNEDPKKIGIKNGQKYCRVCLSFQGKKAELKPTVAKSAFFQLSYDLSDEQRRISNQLLDNYKRGIDTLLNAVTGAGKTELVFRVIRYVIEHGGRVGFSVPRKDVVIELYDRFKSVFTYNKVIAVYGGNNEELDGDLICLTTHQLYRYPDTFDLLIVDEIDAFPYKGNDVLQSILLKSIKGRLIMMSATPSQDIINKFSKDGRDILNLNARYHGYPLPVPKIIIRPEIQAYYYLIKYVKSFINLKKPIFIFTPTINECEKVFKVINSVCKGGNYVHSKKVDREEIIRDFKDQKYQFLVTTAVLERGVTVKDLQVIVFGADSKIYDRYALVQIAGRAGRKINAPTGEVIFIAFKENEEINRCVETIEKSNRDLQSLL